MDAASAPAGGDRPARVAGPRVEGYDPALFTTYGFEHDRGFDTHIGLVYDLLSPDRIEAHLDVTGIHLTPYGDVHGGVHTAIVESVGSIASVARVIADGRAAVGRSGRGGSTRSPHPSSSGARSTCGSSRSPTTGVASLPAGSCAQR